MKKFSIESSARKTPQRWICLLTLGATLMVSRTVSAQLLNPGFEDWSDCLPDNWATPNACGVITPVTRSTSAHSGAFAARGQPVAFGPVTVQPVLQNGPEALGVAISQRFAAVRGYYKFAPVGGDRFAVDVVFSKNGQPIAVGSIAIDTPATTYTAWEVPVAYQSTEVPDNATIQIQIIGPTGPDFHLGSVMFVDDVGFTGGIGDADPLLSIVQTGNSITVSWPAAVTGYVLQSTPILTPPTWVDVPGNSPGNSHQFSQSDRSVYFRLFKP